MQAQVGAPAAPQQRMQASEVSRHIVTSLSEVPVTRQHDVQSLEGLADKIRNPGLSAAPLCCWRLLPLLEAPRGARRRVPRRLRAGDPWITGGGGAAAEQRLHCILALALAAARRLLLRVDRPAQSKADCHLC